MASPKKSLQGCQQSILGWQGICTVCQENIIIITKQHFGSRERARSLYIPVTLILCVNFSDCSCDIKFLTKYPNYFCILEVGGGGVIARWRGTSIRNP